MVEDTLAMPEPQYRHESDDGQHRGNPVMPGPVRNLDSDAARAVLKKCLNWWRHELDVQRENRQQMMVDADFYDNIQWDEKDIAILRERGQMALVFNEIAPMVDWLIGTERRARVDWKVLPRSEDGVAMADIKTRVLKYVADNNRVSFNRSHAFADAVKVGVGWLDDGVRNDPTQDIVYSRYEDWKNVLWDSAAIEPDLSDARYIFRTRWVDEDVAHTMYPERAHLIRAEHSAGGLFDDEVGNDAERAREEVSQSAAGNSPGQRRRVRLIECQFRMPAHVKVIAAGPHKGQFVEPWDVALGDMLARDAGSVIERVMMRMHVAVFTESHLLALGPSPMRHNRFSLTPVWCYRRSRDRQPYGVVRRVRDLQQDLNKRVSRAQFLLSTNQIIMQEGAVKDINEAREEVSQPDGVVIVQPNKSFDIRRDSEMGNGQIQFMTMNAQAIQKVAGVGNDNLGRQSNAISGEAIKARQIQGSVVTTEPFDNLRLAVQIQGEKQLSLIEQWYTEEKVVRLTGVKGAIEWTKINTPELQPDGSVRFLNDITATLADFVVSEQDYTGTLRQAMFDSINEMAARLPPELALRLLAMGMEYSDLPNKDEFAREMRALIGMPEPNEDARAQAQAQQQAQAEAEAERQAQAEHMQQQAQQAALAGQLAKARETHARAQKLEIEADGLARITAMAGP